MNTANALGYLAGALLATFIAHRWGTRRAFVASMVITVAILLVTASTANIGVLVLLRVLAGVSGAITFIAGAGLVAAAVSRVSPHRAATMLGVYFAGAGAGIVASGSVI